MATEGRPDQTARAVGGSTSMPHRCRHRPCCPPERWPHRAPPLRPRLSIALAVPRSAERVPPRWGRVPNTARGRQADSSTRCRRWTGRSAEPKLVREVDSRDSVFSARGDVLPTWFCRLPTLPVARCGLRHSPRLAQFPRSCMCRGVFCPNFTVRSPLDDLHSFERDKVRTPVSPRYR